MTTKVIKRNGTESEFNQEKIFNAIMKAMKNGSGIVSREIASKVAKEIEQEVSETTTIGHIESLVYLKLIENGHKLTAKAYEGFRAIQSYKREVNTTDEGILGLINLTNEEVMNENSNKNAVMASTQRDLIAGETSKDLTRRKLLPSHIVQAHDEGILHFHN